MSQQELKRNNNYCEADWPSSADMVISSMVKKVPPRRPPPTLRIRNYSREWREYRDDMTLEKAAGLSGLSVANISAFERGVQGITDRTLYGLAKAYRCNPQDILHPPGPAKGILDIWDKAKPSDRAKLLEIAKTLIGDDKR